MSDTQTDNLQNAGLIEKLRVLASENQQFLKYLFIGAAASAIDVILFFVMFNIVGTTELVAHSISVPTAVVFSFVVNARHNFKTNDYPLLRFTSFSIICLIGYLAGYGVIEAVQSQFADKVMGANIGKVASLPVVFIIQYILNSLQFFQYRY